MAEAKKPALAPLLPTYRVPLDYLGDAWKDAYVELKDLPWARTRELFRLSKEMSNDDESAEKLFQDALREAFVGGRVPASDGSTIKLTVDLLTDEYFGFDTISTIFSYVIGVLSPKASMRLSGSTPAKPTPPTS